MLLEEGAQQCIEALCRVLACSVVRCLFRRQVRIAVASWLRLLVKNELLGLVVKRLDEPVSLFLSFCRAMLCCVAGIAHHFPHKRSKANPNV